MVNFLGKTDGLVHISEVKNERIEKISDELKEGDEVKVKVLSVERGKVRLSMKRVNQETGEDLSDQFEDDGSRPSRGGRDGGRGGKGRDNRGDRGSRDKNRDNSGNKEEQPKPSNDSSNEPKEDEPKKKRRFF